jgi:peptidoglycan/xylan/chitin deacetylase (PgdA/CDA1 family)
MHARALMYHDLSGCSSGFSDPWAELYKIPEAEFVAHLNAIQQAGLADRVASVERVSEDSRIPLFLTFDDGGSSALRIGEILSSRGWCGHFFITTGCIGQSGFLSASEIRQVHAGGHVIGSHSVSHPTRMRALTKSALDREWCESMETLQEIIGAPVQTGSVPGGFYSRNVGMAAAESGIRHLFYSEPVEAVKVIESCRLLGRYYIQRGASPAQAVGFASGDWRFCMRQRWEWTARKTLKAALGPLYVTAGRLLRRSSGS